MQVMKGREACLIPYTDMTNSFQKLARTLELLTFRLVILNLLLSSFPLPPRKAYLAFTLFSDTFEVPN